jgi:threonine dehydrogenase-like Zn-dependent dehydrogenase
VVQRTARAAVIAEPGAPASVRDVELPALEPGAALLRVELSEVCGTDVHLRAGRLAGVPYPLIPGHVAVGRLEAVNGSVVDVDGAPLREGDRVTFLDVHGTCNACWYCQVAHAATRCPRRRVYGITFGTDGGPAGGWSTHMVLRPGTRIIPLPGTDPDAFMAGGCSLPTALHAVDRARMAIGDVVLVLGSGPVGLSAVALARLSGAEQVLCIGAPAGRLHAARGFGADDVLDIGASTPDERLDWVLERTGGRGADVTIEAAGPPEAVVQALRCTRDAGRVVVVGQYTDHGDVPLNPHLLLNRKHLDVHGCWGSDFSHFHRAARILASPRLAAPWRSLEMRRYALEAADAALDDVAAGRVIKALIDPALGA